MNQEETANGSRLSVSSENECLNVWVWSSNDKKSWRASDGTGTERLVVTCRTDHKDLRRLMLRRILKLRHAVDMPRAWPSTGIHWACNHSWGTGDRGWPLERRQLRPRLLLRIGRRDRSSCWPGIRSMDTSLSSWGSSSFVAADTCSPDVPSCELPSVSWPRRWRASSRIPIEVSILLPGVCWSQSCASLDSLGPSSVSGPGTIPWRHSWASWPDLHSSFDVRN